MSADPTALRTYRTKKPTPLSTRSLAAFLTWKQFDLLLLLQEDGACTTTELSENLAEIKRYDQRHGGAFYTGVDYSSTYSCLRTMEERQLVHRHVGANKFIYWTCKSRGVKATEWLEHNV